MAKLNCVTVLAPAKLNLALDVVGLLPNGYHNLDMTMQAITLYERVVLRRSQNLSLTLPGSPVAANDSNTAIKAALAFFRNSADEKPLKIYIFTAGKQGYEQAAVIEGTGTSIYSIAYEDLDQDGRKELLVGWRVNTDLQALSVYTLRSGEPEELVQGTSYVKYAVNDLNQDGLWELVVLRADEEGNGIADYYCWQEEEFQLRTSARITSTMAELSQQGRVKSGVLQDGTPALFVTGVEESAWMVTDILTVKNGELVNILLSDVTGVSSEIAPFSSLYPEDINGDGEVYVLIYNISTDYSNPNSVTSSQAQLMTQLQCGDNMIVISDGTTDFAVHDFTGELEGDFVSDKGIKLNCALTREKLKWEAMPDELYVGLREPARLLSTSYEQMTENYETALPTYMRMYEAIAGSEK